MIFVGMAYDIDHFFTSYLTSYVTWWKVIFELDINEDSGDFNFGVMVL
jgi:hypothetical protein